MFKFVVVIIALLISHLVYADSSELDKRMQKCGEISSYTHLARCYSDVYKKADHALNEEYNELFTYLDTENQKNLIDAQRKWIKFRDADCFFSDPEPLAGDAVAQTNHYSCLANLTIQRVKKLEHYNEPSNKGCNGCPW